MVPGSPGYSLIAKIHISINAGLFCLLRIDHFHNLRATSDNASNLKKKTPEGEPVREIYVVLITLVGALIMGFLSDAKGLNFNAGAQMLEYIIPEGPPLASILVEKAELFVAVSHAIMVSPYWLRS